MITIKNLKFRYKRTVPLLKICLWTFLKVVLSDCSDVMVKAKVL